MSTERSLILKQTCKWKPQVYLSMCRFLVDIRHERVKRILEEKRSEAYSGPNQISRINCFCKNKNNLIKVSQGSSFLDV